MKQLKKGMLIMSMIILAACGAKKTGDSAVAEKNAELTKLKEQQTALVTKIAGLEAEIAKLDPSTVQAEKAKLVSLTTIAPETFSHYLDLEGKVEAMNISYVTPRNGGGQVKAIFIKKGDAVRKGQLLLQLDNTIAKQSFVTAEQGLQTLRTQLAFAKTIYQKQKNLWAENIGTEVQLLTAKNNVDNLQSQLSTSEEQVKLYKEQLNFTNIYSDVDGVADDVNVRVGEAFTGFMGTGPQIKIVNSNDLKVTVNIPENYLNKVIVGSKIKINLPDIKKSIEATVSVVSNLIDANSRSFYIEAKIPAGKEFHPNQIAMVNIQDYTNPTAITVSVNTLQNDDKGKFVLVAVNEGGKLRAKKKMVTIGDLYADKLEIKSGLAAGDVVIIDGYQGLYEGQLLTTK